EHMLDNSGMSCVNFSKSLQGWANNENTAENVILGAYGLSYTYGIVESVNKLAGLSGMGWVINGADNSGGCKVFDREPMITRWKTDNPGSSNDDQITIPATGNYFYVAQKYLG